MTVLEICLHSLWTVVDLSDPKSQIHRQTPRFCCFDKLKVITPSCREHQNLHQHFSSLSFLICTYSPSLPSTFLYRSPLSYIRLITDIFLPRILLSHLYMSIFLHASIIFHCLNIFLTHHLSVLLLTAVLSLGRVQFLLILCQMRCD